ncbi:LOW QUALITY PROTEIN: protein artichoke-like [Thrips palmi]|uniref:LOW QUALITY PROTEIN: protein artichoke-like n=1 Tax=Thrips palmi TaxID=161013 RepID=A0A6P8ZSX8_THRPL|nr:LOW QUALITY PROTEIN: protein artichoke-like [Thrips palmi]
MSLAVLDQQASTSTWPSAWASAWPAAGSVDDTPLCEDVHPELRVPCRCSFIHSRRAGEEHVTVEVAMDCDRVVFPGEMPALPARAPIVAFSQRWAGHQALPTQALTTAELPLRRLDLAGNSLRRLSDRQLAGHLAAHLQELILADNLLGDNLNPIFSASEFHGLRELRMLDLSGNQIKGLEEGILKGCDNLQELRLNRNSLAEVPSQSLHGPRALRALALARNRIALVRGGALEGLQQLARLDLSFNTINTLEGGALKGLSRLQELNLSHNRVTKLNSDVFEGAVAVEVLDLSQNFLREVPSVAFKELTKLRHLNMSANLIQRLDNEALRVQTQLETLDLSGNNIGNIAPGTFRGLRALRHLDLSVNALRTVEDDAFEGLEGLETLRLRDNNILAVPASALGRLPRLRTLSLDYNRLAVVSADLLRAVSERASDLGLARNVIRELSPAAFRDFTRLRRLDLSANLLLALDASALVGLEDILEELNLAGNRIASLAGGPLALRRLKVLDLSDNQLQGLGRAPLSGLPALEVLNLSGNPLLAPSPTGGILTGLARLRVLDMSRVGMRALSADLLHRAADLESVALAGNALQELPEGAFASLVNLTAVDLSGNQLANIRAGAFTGLPSLRRLNLSRNKLQAFRGEVLESASDGSAGSSALRELDLSQNQLGYLFPNSFRAHPRLRRLLLAQNKLTFFPGELLTGLRYLEEVDLAGNLLKAVDDMDFARLPRLRELDLSDNQLEALSETAFHNSTQLQVVRLARNRLERLSERTFEGLCRIELLDLEGNLLAELPDALFERGRVHILDNINLAANQFEVAPLPTLQRQYFFLSSVDLSRNRLVDIPADDTIMVNIKRLDLSFNPLSQSAIANVLAEPKTVRELNMAGTGIQSLTQLETPFLRSLNLSHNNISHFGKEVVARPTLLEMLDLSHNRLATFPRVWTQLRHLQALDVSHNPIPSIVQGDLDGLGGLRSINLDALPVLSRLERSAMAGLSSLSSLRAAGFPRLGYLDAAGLLRSLPFLTTLRIELKDPTVGGDTLAPALQPRLQELGLHGARVRSLSSSALAGLKAARVRLLLTDTSLAALPPALFFPLPRSCRLVVDVTRAKLPTLSPQLLAALDDRRGLYTLQGLSTNPLHCDCAARALRRWLPGSGMGDLRCHSPPSMEGRLLVEVGDDDLTCDPNRAHQQATTTTTPSSTTSSTTNTPIITMLSGKHHPTRYHARPGQPTTEPDIIWSLPPTTPRPHQKVVGANMMSPRPPQGAAVVSNDDTLIIGIVGGVVAFIAILVIVICIVRLRLTSNQYRGGPMAAGALAGPLAVAAQHAQHAQHHRHGMPTGEYGPPPMYLSPYAAHGYATATLPPHSKMHHNHSMPGMAPSLAPSLAASPRRTSYASLGRPPQTPTPCYPQQSPYYITFSGEEKEHR